MSTKVARRRVKMMVDADPLYMSIVDKGANRRPFKVLKMAKGGGTDCDDCGLTTKTMPDAPVNEHTERIRRDLAANLQTKMGLMGRMLHALGLKGDCTCALCTGTQKAARTDVQTLVFDAEKFSADAARTWAENHDFHAGKVDETEGSVRLRQKDPSACQEGTFRTIELTDGVQAVICRPKGQQGEEKAASDAIGTSFEHAAAALEFGSPSLFDAFMLAQGVVLNILDREDVADKQAAVADELGKFQQHVLGLVGAMPIAKRAAMRRLFEVAQAAVHNAHDETGEVDDMTTDQLQTAIKTGLDAGMKGLLDAVSTLGARVAALENPETPPEKGKGKAQAKADEVEQPPADADAKAKADDAAAADKAILDAIKGAVENMRDTVTAEIKGVAERVERIERSTGLRQGASTTSLEDRQLEHTRKHGTRVTKAVAACHAEKDQIVSAFLNAGARRTA